MCHGFGSARESRSATALPRSSSKLRPSLSKPQQSLSELRQPFRDLRQTSSELRLSLTELRRKFMVRHTLRIGNSPLYVAVAACDSRPWSPARGPGWAQGMSVAHLTSTTRQPNGKHARDEAGQALQRAVARRRSAPGLEQPRASYAGEKTGLHKSRVPARRVCRAGEDTRKCTPTQSVGA